MSFPTAPATHHQAFYGNKPPQDGPFYAPSLGYHQKVRDYLDYCNASYKGATFSTTQGVQNGNILPSPRNRSLLNSCINGMSDDGILSYLDSLWIFATDGSTGVSFTNLTNPALYTCSFNGAGGSSFDGVYGFTSGKANGVFGVNTSFNPSLHGVNFTQDNNSLFCFVDLTHFTGATNNPNGDLFGNSANSSGGFLFSLFGNYEWRQNGTTSSQALNAKRKSRYFIHTKRVSSSTKQLFIDGVLHTTASETSAAFVSSQFTIGKNLSTGQSVNTRFGIFGIGASLDGLEYKLNYRVQKYMAGVI